jgi:serine/threonine-protein kinase
MGCVYEGEHEILKERRAIKVCKVLASRSAKERAVNEARAMARLQHPGICKLFDVQWGPPDGTSPVMVMELLHGHTFFDEISRGPLDWRRAVQVACDVLDALTFAHEQGVVHRDIKPENVFIATERGAPATKVMDFGIAKLAGVSATKTGMQMGTPHYMSPEQCTNAKSVDARADIYSVAATLYRSVTGQHVFAGTSAYEIIAGHLNDPPRPVRSLMPSVPEHVAGVIHRGLAKSREDRHKSAAEMRAVLLRCLDAGDAPLKAAPEATTLPPEPVPVAIERETNRPWAATAPTLGETPVTRPEVPTPATTVPDRNRTPLVVSLIAAALAIAIAAAWWALKPSPAPTPAVAPAVAAPAVAAPTVAAPAVAAPAIAAPIAPVPTAPQPMAPVAPAAAAAVSEKTTEPAPHHKTRPTKHHSLTAPTSESGLMDPFGIEQDRNKGGR